MNEDDVFAKLSRILETNTFASDDATIDRLIHAYIQGDDGNRRNDSPPPITERLDERFVRDFINRFVKPIK